MKRMDENMPFLLKYENVAWFDKGKVRILDRRIFPERRFVSCESYMEVKKAIADMVTQSAGPYTAVGMGMALAACEVRGKSEKEQLEYLSTAAFELAHARPTTANRYGQITYDCLHVAQKALSEGKDPAEEIKNATVESLNRRYGRMRLAGDYLLDLIPEGGAILTQCYGETIIGTLIQAALEKGRKFRVYCAETRPYLQGARLTASCFQEMGFETTVLTDNMIAYAMENEGIDLFTSAADTIARDGHIANKVGTFQIAILAQHFGVPYYVTGIPDTDKQARDDIKIEMRDPAQVLEYRGIKTTLPGVRAIYPAFDITPPELIKGVITDKGIYSPRDLNSYFEGEQARFY